MKEIIKVRSLQKTYKGFTAVDEISFEVYEGEIFGMVGPNGAGKTTTIECIEGLRKPDAGSIRVLDLDPQLDNKTLRTRVGMQLQQSNLPDRMKVWEALDLYSAFYETPVDWKKLLNQLGLEEKRDARFGKLSGGQKQRLFIALALLPNPNLVFLDELTTGLDPQARHTIWDLVRSVRDQGKTIYLTTHFMEEAERLCDRVAILDHGKIVALDTPQALIRGLSQNERVSFTLDVSITAEIQKSFAALGTVEVQADKLTLIGKSTDSAQLVTAVVNLLTGLSLRYRDLRTEQPTLEDVFLNLTGRQIRE